MHFFFDGYILLRTIPRCLHTIVAPNRVQARGLRPVIELACSLTDWPVILHSELLRNRDSSQSRAYQPGENRRYLRAPATGLGGPADTTRISKAG